MNVSIPNPYAARIGRSTSHSAPATATCTVSSQVEHLATSDINDVNLDSNGQAHSGSTPSALEMVPVRDTSQSQPEVKESRFKSALLTCLGVAATVVAAPLMLLAVPLMVVTAPIALVGAVGEMVVSNMRAKPDKPSLKQTYEAANVLPHRARMVAKHNRKFSKIFAGMAVASALSPLVGGLTLAPLLVGGFFTLRNGMSAIQSHQKAKGLEAYAQHAEPYFPVAGDEKGWILSN